MATTPGLCHATSFVDLIEPDTNLERSFMRYLTIIIALLALFATQASLAGDILTVPIRVPVAEGVSVPNAVLAECELERRLAKSLASEAKGPYKKVVMKPTVSAETPGHALDIKITAVLGSGGGRYSGPKSVTAEGTLYADGKILGTFVARRHTTRGRHTCRMLQRDAEEIAEDVGKWLKAPVMDARLGDAG
jgi:hypothetical protein